MKLAKISFHPSQILPAELTIVIAIQGKGFIPHQFSIHVGSQFKPSHHLLHSLGEGSHQRNIFRLCLHRQYHVGQLKHVSLRGSERSSEWKVCWEVEEGFEGCPLVGDYVVWVCNEHRAGSVC